jgi:hypothetical protein
MIRAIVLAVAAAGANAAGCVFCTTTAQGQAVNFDLSGLSNTTYESAGEAGEVYTLTTPCGQAKSASCGWQNDPMLQSCLGVGSLANISIVMSSPAEGFTLTLYGGFDTPPMPNGRNAVYDFICDTTVPLDNPPYYKNVTESPPGFYNVVWRTPAACGVVSSGQCGPNPPVPPPAPPPTPCTPGSKTCLPTWKPTWDMRNSTVLYTCNNSGFLDVSVGKWG